MGHGGAGDRSVGGGSPWIERVANSLMRFCREGERPCREWWAVLGTVTEALEGLGSCGFGNDGAVGAEGPCVVEGVLRCCLFLKYDGGKCFAL